MMDPTYDQKEIRARPEWDLAFVLSEILNDDAPLGWSKYAGTAKSLLATFELQRKGAPHADTQRLDAIERGDVELQRMGTEVPHFHVFSPAGDVFTTGDGTPLRAAIDAALGIDGTIRRNTPSN